MKKILNKKKIIFFIILIVIVIFLFPIKIYTYNDYSIPGQKYKIKLNRITKELHGEFYHYCSAVDCETSVYNYSITLTKDEYKKVMNLWHDKDTLSPILESLCKNNEIFGKDSGDAFEESLKKYDLNSDGKVTYREFGNVWLNDALSGE